jgi:hypothetical protein
MIIYTKKINMYSILLSLIQPQYPPYTIEPLHKYQNLIEQLRINGREFIFTDDPLTIYPQLVSESVWSAKFEHLIDRRFIKSILQFPPLKEIGQLLIQKYPFEVCYIHNNKINDRIIIINYYKWEV